jgi:serine/threonine protein kinase
VEDHEEQPFIVMQLLQGQTLRDRLASLHVVQKKFQLAELLDIAGQICLGLEAAHGKGIIHRDIKPANIFLTTSGQVKILDFGLAKLMGVSRDLATDELRLPAADTAAAAPQLAGTMEPDPTLTRLGVAVGTAGYMSPEQVRGESLDSRTDIFSFGLVLYEMATGLRAFTGETAAIIHHAILNRALIPVGELNPELPPRLQTVIHKTLEKDKEKRYQTASEVGNELLQLKGELDFQRVGTERQRVFWSAAGSMVLLLVLVTGWVATKLLWRRDGSLPVVKQQQITANPLEDPVIASTQQEAQAKDSTSPPPSQHFHISFNGSITFGKHLWYDLVLRI